MRKTSVYRWTGAMLIALAMAVSGSLVNGGGALGYRLYPSILLAAGLTLMGAVDEEALGSVAEALLACAAGAGLLLYGRVAQGWRLTFPEMQGLWADALPPSTMLGVGVVLLLAVHAVRRGLRRQWRGWDARRLATLVLIVAAACTHRQVSDQLFRIQRELGAFTVPEAQQRAADLWWVCATAFHWLGGVVLLPLLRPDLRASRWLAAVGGAYLTLYAAGFLMFGHAEWLRGVVSWLGVNYSDAPVYTGLLLCGLNGLCSRSALKR